MRWIIAILTAAAALVAALNEVASLDRFAAEKLHFPANLSWSLPGMVTIATLAGALMWTLLQQVPLRRAGKRLNLACAFISAAAVGLDHASGAEGWWILAAGLVGALVPALATWLTHLLARMTADQPKTPVEVALPSAASTGTNQPTNQAADQAADQPASQPDPPRLALAPRPASTCECGCGEEVGTDQRGRPRRYVNGHNKRATKHAKAGVS